MTYGSGDVAQGRGFDLGQGGGAPRGRRRGAASDRRRREAARAAYDDGDRPGLRRIFRDRRRREDRRADLADADLRRLSRLRRFESLRRGPRFVQTAKALQQQPYGSHADEIETSLMLAIGARLGRHEPGQSFALLASRPFARTALAERPEITQLFAERQLRRSHSGIGREGQDNSSGHRRGRDGGGSLTTGRDSFSHEFGYHVIPRDSRRTWKRGSGETLGDSDFGRGDARFRREPGTSRRRGSLPRNGRPGYGRRGRR